ncbi:hypothetical protein ACFXJ8_40235 [Nonomuraea sp. NPDC059194]|uniref:hypothetical protein n=1 Tax=Nonomuraea sp. NPDC059194 TaxID=3346764 RepID=UPI0036C8BDB5
MSAGDRARARRLAFDAVHVIEVSAKTHARDAALKMLVAVGELNHAERLAVADGSSLLSTNELVKAVAATGDLDRAEAIIRRIRDLYHAARAWIELVTAMAHAGDPDRAESVARAMTDPGDRSEALAALGRVS